MRQGRRFAIALTVPVAVLAMPAIVAAQDHSANHRQYKAVDLGTFGGPQSYLNPASTYGSPNQINDRGTAVGGSDTSIPPTPTSNGFICFGPTGLVPFVNHAFERRNGVVTDLGTLAGPENCSVATSVNEGGRIAGTSENGVVDPILGVTEVRAVVWNHGQIQDLGTLGGNHSAACCSNDRGQVAGLALNSIPDPFAFFGAGTEVRAFRWQEGRMNDLGTLGGPDALATGVNQRGHVAGYSYTSYTPNPTTGLPTVDPFLWKDGTMTDLGTLGGTNGVSLGLNNRGQVFGFSNLAGDQVADPFLWDGEKLIDLYAETSGGNIWTADAIDDAGRVVGAADFSAAGGFSYAAALWKNGKAIDLGTPKDDCCSEAFAINSAGQIVGVVVSNAGEQRAVLWEEGSMVELNSKLPPGFPLRLAVAFAINERGEIGGSGLPAGCDDNDTCSHAFLLIPDGQDDDGDLEDSAVATPSAVADADPRPTTIRETPSAQKMVARIRDRMARRPQRPGSLSSQH